MSSLAMFLKINNRNLPLGFSQNSPSNSSGQVQTGFPSTAVHCPPF